MPFEFHPDPNLPEVIIVEPRAFHDDRGWFAETYRHDQFLANGIPGNFCQDNHAYSKTRGVIRGIHFQRRPDAQGKLVRCLRGAVLDVAVDLREDSPSYAKWTGVELSADNRRQLWVPEGFGHAYLTLTDNTEVAYKTTAYYAPSSEGCIRWNDPVIDIDWGIPQPIVAPRDAEAPELSDAGPPFAYRGPGTW